MTALPFQIEELTPEHLDALICAEATEGMSLEFKSEAYGPDHDGVREFLKDVTSLANTAGGFLLIGMSEEGGTAKAICPIALPDPDKMKQRLESLIQSAVEPRIFGVRMHPIVVSGGYVLAIRVPRSATPPHRVTAKNSNRFYLRSSAGAYEASMEQLRGLFSETGDVRDRVLKFRDERFSAILQNRGIYPLVEDDRAILHIVPLAFQGIAQPINMGRVSAKQMSFRPMGDSMGFSPKFNVDGFANSSGGTGCEAYTQVFREGTIEAVCRGVVGSLRDVRVVMARKIQDTLFEALPRYLDGLKDLDVNPPFFVAVSLIGVGDAIVVCSRAGPAWRSEYPPRLTEPALKLPICVVEDYGGASFYHSRLKPALDALWNAGNLSEWQPEKQHG